MKYFTLFFALFLSQTALTQPTKSYTSAQLFEMLQKAQVLGSVLYVAAHPDDENTRMISYLANKENYETTYLSLTRGDGGQNLIGSEIQELLGVIRTQELLAARRIDGGKQMFSRANDFGYSKNPTETLKVWNEDEVLADVVWAIRKIQPDVIINRFSNDPNSRTHGHHTSSAILSTRAFDLSNDPSQYPEQLQYVDTWQANRLMWNTSWWFYRSRENFAKVDKSKMVAVDVGVYYPLKGKSNTEIAAESRSQHQCQGMGSTSSRGQSIEYLEFLKGHQPTEDLFSGINTTWSRVPGGAMIGEKLSQIENNFNHVNPSASVPALAEVYAAIQQLPDGKWKSLKSKEVKDLLVGCMGLFAEAITTDYSTVAGGSVGLNIEMINRSEVPVELKGIEIPSIDFDTTLSSTLAWESPFKWSKNVHFDTESASTNAYWLNDQWELGMYTVEDQEKRGLPETPQMHEVHFELELEGRSFEITRPFVYKKTDRVVGEFYRPFEIIAPVSVELDNKVEIMVDESPRTISVSVKAGKDNCQGALSLDIPEGWEVSPQSIPFELSIKGEKAFYEFELIPPSGDSEGRIVPIAKVDGTDYSRSEVIIEYGHIPTQTIYRPASAKVVKLDLKKYGHNIGYIMGSGDAIPASLEQIGYNVRLLDESYIQSNDLSVYDAIIVGIRAYNTNDWMKYQQAKLLKYVEEGGTMIVQYNTSRGLVTSDLGPYPMKLSRDRVSVEEAPVKILAPDHAVMNEPNPITLADFDGWIQERGLYFPNEWDDRYTPILSSNDPGEPARDGGLLVAAYGQGHYVYSGYSWFRELPAGVPGAYKIFANLVSLGNDVRP